MATRFFFQKCKDMGVDGLILPDLPLEVYEKHYKKLLTDTGITISFLITPQTPEARIRKIDKLSTGFVYVVSSYAITGAKTGISTAQIDYFKRIQAMKLKNPTLIGFGISDKETFDTACQYANGAIIGSAFIKALAKGDDVKVVTKQFIASIKNKAVIASAAKQAVTFIEVFIRKTNDKCLKYKMKNLW